MRVLVDQVSIVISTRERVRRWLLFAWLEREVEQRVSSWTNCSSDLAEDESERIELLRTNTKKSFKCLLTEYRIALLCQYIDVKNDQWISPMNGREISNHLGQKKAGLIHQSLDAKEIDTHPVVTWTLNSNRKWNSTFFFVIYVTSRQCGAGEKSIKFNLHLT